MGYYRAFASIRTLLSVAFLTLIMGCATTGVNRGDLNLVSIEEEWQMGEQLERELAGQLTLVNDAAALNYLNSLGQRIVQQTELASVPWTFHIVADKEVNAFNIPGGHVYVNAGLIAAAANASELAGVMAHEIAHGVARHGTERLTKTYGLNIGASILLGQDPGMIEQIAAQIAAGGAIAKFSRSDEREADQLGVRYMQRSGYDPNGMITMFQSLLGERRQSPGALEQFFSTHPLTEERIENVRGYISELPSGGNLRTNDSGFAGLKQRTARYAR